jgi:hypothetical protein
MTDSKNSENHFHLSSTVRISTVSYGQEARRLECTKRYEDPPQFGLLVLVFFAKISEDLHGGVLVESVFGHLLAIFSASVRLL